MRKLDALATLPHYQEHLLPIWEALPPEVRGTFWVTGRGVDQSQGTRLNLAKLRDGSGLLLIAGAHDAQKAKGRPLVYVEHGAGQTYVGVSSASYSGAKGYDSVALFICPSETVADRWRATYPHIPAVAVGCPRLDRWHRSRPSPSITQVAITFHWSNPLCPEANWALPAYKGQLAELKAHLASWGIELLGHGHPRAWGPLERVWTQLGITLAPKWEDIMRARLLIGDNSSALPEWASMGRPVLWLNAPTWRREVWHGGRFWDWPKGQVQCDTADQLIPQLEAALEDPPEVREARAQMVQSVYAHTDGRAAERAAQAILEVLMNRRTFGSSGGPRTAGGAGEVRDPLEHFLGRLAELGATPEEVAAVADHWYLDAPDWDDEARQKLIHASDGVLLAHIRQVRAEWEEVRPHAAR